MSRRKLNLSPTTGTSGATVDDFESALAAQPVAKTKKKDSKAEQLEKQVATLSAKVQMLLANSTPQVTQDDLTELRDSLLNQGVDREEYIELKATLRQVQEAQVTATTLKNFKKEILAAKSPKQGSLVSKEEFDKLKSEVLAAKTEDSENSKIEELREEFKQNFRKAEIACSKHPWLCQMGLAEKLLEVEEQTKKFATPKDTSVLDLHDFQAVFVEAIANTLGADAVILHKLARFSLLEYSALSMVEQSCKMIPSSSAIFAELHDLRK